MTESELLQTTMDAVETALSVFSLFFTIVSAYLVALYWFLHNSPMVMKLLAFIVLSAAFVFIAAVGWNLQYFGHGLSHSWDLLQQKTTGMQTLGPPFVVRSVFLDGREIMAWIGWGLGTTVYVLLGYLTFIYRWPHNARSE
jgi:hypothetical protein